MDSRVGSGGPVPNKPLTKLVFFLEGGGNFLFGGAVFRDNPREGTTVSGFIPIVVLICLCSYFILKVSPGQVLQNVSSCQACFFVGLVAIIDHILFSFL